MLLINLIKMKLRSIRTAMIIIGGIMLGVTVIGTLSFIAGSNDTFGTVFGEVANMMGIMLAVMGIICGAAIGILMCAYSVYEIYGTDMAYLYFTLPAKRKTVMNAGLISFTAGILIFTLLAFVCIMILVLPQIDMSPDIDTDQIVEETSEIMLLSWLNGISSFIFGIISVTVACVFGCSIAKKHKLLGSVITYLIIGAIMSTAAGMLNGIILTFIHREIYIESYYLSVNIQNAVEAAINITASIVGYFLALRRLNNQFDIE